MTDWLLMHFGYWWWPAGICVLLAWEYATRRARRRTERARASLARDVDRDGGCW